MRIIDAVWEKRNIGCNTKEVLIEQNDSEDEIREVLSHLDAEYVVVKIPVGEVKSMFAVEKIGFRFVETIIGATHDLKALELSGLSKRIDESVQYKLMNQDDLEQLFLEIENGLFETDRISLDPYFTKEQSANRYIGWIKDELLKSSEIFKLIYKNESIGFFTFKEIEPDVYYPFLAGMYKNYQNNALSTVFNYKPLLEAKKRGAKMVSTYISSNNPKVVRLHIVNGYQFGRMEYVYVKHCNVE